MASTDKGISLNDNSIPEAIRKHLHSLAEAEGKHDNPEYLDELYRVWQKKAVVFHQACDDAGLQLLDSLELQDERGFLVLTYSGSLLSMGPRVFNTQGRGGRWSEYSSIKLRTDVPDIIMEKDADIAANVSLEYGVKLNAQRLKSTSPVYILAVCPPGISSEEQDKRIRESSIYITTAFMKYNRTLQLDRDNVPDQFTMKSMTRYIAKKHNLTGNEARLLIDDFLTLVETGMLLGESVPLGKIGRFSVKIRGAQKARKVKHPGTGEEMVIEAKPSMGVPKISFSSYLKERAATLGDRPGQEPGGDYAPERDDDDSGED
ncbi:HU family DNA-binding protein [Salinispira pacifica]|uniref:HU domain-containing protein n=1 Tax=Salinispira pacifica TaxID=1307761 RepID=V5WMJ3_9SPIO|nr:HU family DNA-binding protein [Salinispira pacifica]AHC16386.1 hypothetical protein L21SP2_3042 [Salinispira pacifica]